MKNGCAVKVTILEDGKMVDWALGVIEKPNWLDTEKPERKIAWLEVFGNRYLEGSMYSGGETGGGFNDRDTPRTDDPEKKITVITRDPSEAIRFLDKEAEDRQTRKALGL